MSSPDTPRVTRRQLVLLFAIVVAIKLGFLIASRHNPFVLCLTNDESYWIAEANDILQNGLIRHDAFWGAPLYPYMLAALFALVGQSVWTILTLQAVLGAANVVVVVVLASKVLDRTRAVWVAGALTLLFGPLYMYETLVLKSTVAVLATDLALLLLVVALEGSRRLVWFACGLAFGLLTLLRGTFLLVLPFVMLALLLEVRRNRMEVRSLAVWMVGIACGILPATVHNAIAAMDFVPTTYQGGTMFYIGNREGASGSYQPLRPGRGHPDQEQYDAVTIAERSVGQPLWPSEITRFWLREGLREIGSHPVEWVRLMAWKALLYHADAETMDVVDYRVYREVQPLLWLAPVSFGLILGLAIPGLYLGRHLAHAPLLGLLLVGSMVSVVTFFVFARYRLPALTLYVLFAAVTVDRVLEYIRCRQWRPAAAVLVVVIGIYMASRITIEVAKPAMGYNTLGGLYARIGDLDNARRYLERAVRELPDRGELRFNLGNVLLRQGRGCEAADQYEMATRDRGLLDAARTDPVVRLQLFEIAAALSDALDACQNQPQSKGRAAELLYRWATTVLADVDSGAIVVDEGLLGRLRMAATRRPP